MTEEEIRQELAEIRRILEKLEKVLAAIAIGLGVSP